MFIRLCVSVFAFALAAPAVEAGAFLQPEGKWLVIEQLSMGRLRPDCDCATGRKLAIDTTVEWGVIAPITIIAQISNLRRITGPGRDDLTEPTLQELGARLRLAQIGSAVVSSQLTLRAADAPLLPGSGGLPWRELRAMVGQSFNMASGPAFWSLAPGFRQSDHRPPQAHLEAAAGVFLGDRWQAIGQLFSEWRRGGGFERAGRQHKAQASLVFNPGRHWSLQLGGFASLQAVGLPQERGWLVAVWKRM